MIDQAKLQRILADPAREERLLNDNQVPLIHLGFVTGTTSPTDAILKLEVYVQTANDTLILPIAISRTQCTELSKALARLAVLPHQVKADQKQN